MKKILAIFASVITFFFISCNDSSKEDKTETAVVDTTATSPAPSTPAPEPVFTPFKEVMIKHKVKDFTAWLAGYMAHDSMRQVYGISHYRLGRGMDDSNMVMVVDKITDVQKAREFGNSPDLKKAMSKAGVIGKPDIALYNVIRSDDTKPASMDRLSVTHKVKDFAAWLKVYDEEGKAERAENGLADRAMARSIDDSNTVRIVFVVTDMAKAKARTSSEELKKIMTDAGVISKPVIFWYRLVQE